jgi:ribonucleoside-diphosphate reductase beta chain
MKSHPEIFAEIKKETDAIFHAVIEGEYLWTDKLFSEGRYCENINATRVKNYVKYSARSAADLLGIEGFESPEINPLPYMDFYTKSSNVQVAPQELQLSAYLVNSVKGISSREKLLTKLAVYDTYEAFA